MKENLKDILSNLNPGIDQETLLLYLQGKLTPEKQHELERQMLDNDFDLDALEGLENFRDKQKLALVLEQLNTDLRKNTKRKKDPRRKRPMQFDSWLLIAVAIMLLLVVISYFIIHMLIT